MSQTSNSLMQPGKPETAPRWQAVTAATLVLMLAFLLASFPARNSDVFRHLAAGRLLASGDYTLGVDPFANTTDGIRWVHHSWLADMALYAFHQTISERLVFLKALVIAGMALFLVRTAGVRTHPWIAGLSVGIGLIGVGQFLTLTPQVVSYFLFAFTLWRLRQTVLAREPDSSWRAQAPMLVGFVVWANGDDWFLLGPATVALALLTRPGGDYRKSLILVALSVGVCLVNGHHIWAFRLPAALTTSDSAATGLGILIAAPWAKLPMPQIGFALLIALGVLSLLYSESRSWKLIAAAMLAISVYRSAAIPFYALAVSLLIADTWQSAWRERLDGQPIAGRRTWLAPASATIALAALVVAACPGWLQGTFEPRGWHVVVDPSMKAIAENRLNERAFHTSIELAHYVEWFSTGDRRLDPPRVFLDGRRNLFPAEVVAEYQRLSAALQEPNPQKARELWADVRLVFKNRDIRMLYVADPVDRRLALALRNVLQHPGEWTLTRIRGRAAMFAAGAGEPGLEAALDVVTGNPAPRHGPGREPRLRAWFDCFVWNEPDGALERDEANLNVMLFDALQPRFLERSRKVWETQLVAAQLGTIQPQGSMFSALAGCPAVALLAAGEPAKEMTPLQVHALQMLAAHTQASDQGPPGALLRAIRSARRSIETDPDDPLAYLALGRAYERLQRLTSERGARPTFTLIEQMRHIQALVALKRAVRLRVDLPAAHELLAGIYVEARGLDLALLHLQAQLRLAKDAGPRPGENADLHAARVERLAEEERKLGKQVRELMNQVDAQSFKLDAYAKARLAVSQGLPAYALEQLLRSSYGEVGVQGAVMQFRLLLLAGRVEDLRSMIEPAQEATMGSFNYRLLQALLAGADGDYDRAEEELNRLVGGPLDFPELGVRRMEPRAVAALFVGQQVLHGGAQQPILEDAALGPWQSPQTQVLFLNVIDNLTARSRQDADIHALRGILSLESGAIDPAARAFRQCLDTWTPDTGSTRLARHYLSWLEK